MHFMSDIDSKGNENKNRQVGCKLKIFCFARKAINRVKRQPIKWEKRSAKHMSDQGLISKICLSFLAFASEMLPQG